MCVGGGGGGAERQPLRIAAATDSGAIQNAEAEQRLRQRRAGLAGDVLTSPVGVTGAVPGTAAQVLGL